MELENRVESKLGITELRRRSLATIRSIATVLRLTSVFLFWKSTRGNFPLSSCPTGNQSLYSVAASWFSIAVPHAVSPSRQTLLCLAPASITRATSAPVCSTLAAPFTQPRNGIVARPYIPTLRQLCQFCQPPLPRLPTEAERSRAQI